jgi:hypothetical protein
LEAFGALFLGTALGRADYFAAMPTWGWLTLGLLILPIGLLAARNAEERNRQVRTGYARLLAAEKLVSAWQILRNGLIPAFIADEITDLRFELFSAYQTGEDVEFECTSLFYDSHPLRTTPSDVGLQMRSSLYAELATEPCGIAVDLNDAASILESGLSTEFLRSAGRRGFKALAIVRVRTQADALGLMVVSSSRPLQEVHFGTPDLIGRLLAIVSERVASEMETFLREQGTAESVGIPCSSLAPYSAGQLPVVNVASPDDSIDEAGAEGRRQDDRIRLTGRESDLSEQRVDAD